MKGVMCREWDVCVVCCAGWLVGMCQRERGKRREERREWGEKEKRTKSAICRETEIKKFAQVEKKRNLRFFRRLKKTSWYGNVAFAASIN